MGADAPRGDGMISLERFKDGAAGRGFERCEFLPGSTFKPAHVAIICPLRGPMIHKDVAARIYGLMIPPNQNKAIFLPHGHEVGHAYNETLKAILADPNISKWPYVLSIEDDQLVPPDTIQRLAETLEMTGWDAVSGIYWTKGEMNIPQVWGDAEEYRRTGVLNFRPVDPVTAINRGATAIESNGIGMGCALWRMDLFREVAAPWFVTTCDWDPSRGASSFTQDLFFWNRAKKMGKRCGVDLRVKVGHMDLNSQIVY